MKKFFFLLSVAAVAMTACTNESNEYVGSSEAREITFSPITQNMTRGTSDGTTFNPTYIKVAAYDITHSRVFFTETEFTKGTTYWSASKYWPLSATAISFLGYTECNSTSSTSPAVFTNTQTLELTMDDNSDAQKDLMYACGFGAVTVKDGTNGNGLDFPNKVDMEFKHAQAWIAFTVNADATTSGKIKLKSIKLNGANYSGKYTVTHANWNSTTAADHTASAVSGVWSNIGTNSNEDVPGWTEADVTNTTAGVPVGDGLLVVPDDKNNSADFTSFDITYMLDGKYYTYTYTPAPASLDLEQGKKYTYNITFKLHEILINPSVENWGSGSSTAVSVI